MHKHDHSVFFYFAIVDGDYAGPKLEDGKVTLKFMTDLMEWYKDQKVLHKQYAYKVNKIRIFCIMKIYKIIIKFRFCSKWTNIYVHNRLL